ncbi:unnamed protein product [Closterium sp. NIES-64]|nr:unnamed protein product [Closterium sp. NIES-64]
MATPSVLAFDAEGRAIDFDVWVDDLQLFLQCDRADGLSRFDLTSGASPAPAVDADATVRSQWATRDAAARLAVRRHLPTSERAHFSQYKSAQTLYDAVVARYSSLATAALSRLMLPYLFPDLAAFPTVADLITHLRTSDTRYPALRFLLTSAPRTPPPMYITLYYIVTRLPDSLRVVRDHFLSVCSTTLIVDLLEKSLLAAEKSIDAVGASRGDPRTTIFEVRRLPLAGDAALARARGAGALEGRAGAVEVEVEAAGGVGVAVGVVVGVEVSVAAVEAEAAAAVAVGAEVAEVAAVEEAVEAAGSSGGGGGGGRAGRGSTQRSGSGGGPRQQQQRGRETLSPSAALDEGDCYRCFPPDPGIGTAALGTGEAAALGACDAAALGASASASSGTGESALSGTTPASASLTFTLDSGASCSFFRDRTTLTQLSRPVAVSLADPSGGPVLSHFSTVLPCSAAPSGTLSGLYLPSFSTNLVSGADLQDGGVHQFTPARQRVTHCTEASTGRHLATLPGPGPTCVPCVEGRQRAAPHSSQFPPTEAPLQTLHMDVWGPARVRRQGHERYFLLVVDDYSRYTAVFPLRSKGDVTEVLIDWIRAARLQLRQSFGSDFPVLRLHSDRGGEFSSGLLRAYCRARGIRETFTLPDSPQQNGIAERRIGMVMDVAPLLWTGKVGDASAFRVWGSRAFVRDLSADKLSPCAAPCVFLGFPPDAPGWQFYHPTSRRVLSYQDVLFDESVPY